jgi:predicted PurR-regulated permease PerM
MATDEPGRPDDGLGPPPDLPDDLPGGSPGESGSAIAAGLPRERPSIPTRRYAAFWGMGVLIVGGSYLVLQLIGSLSQLISWLVIATFFTTLLNPLVNFAQHRMHMPRVLSVLVVFLLGVIVLSAITYAFVKPVYSAGRKFADDIPHLTREAEKGRGPFGKIVKKYHIDRWVRQNAPKLRSQLGDAGGPALSAAQRILSGLVATVTVLVLTFLLLLEAPLIIEGFLALFPTKRADRIRRVGGDATRAVSGYMGGNVLISIIAGIATYVFLRATGVPFAGVLALWVAFADLIPLVGATLGAIPPIFVALLHRPILGLVTLIFFIVYQQFENHVLQTTIMAKTVKLNPLLVILSVIIGIELGGFVGAVLAIPAAGVIQIVFKEVWLDREERVRDALAAGSENLE